MTDYEKYMKYLIDTSILEIIKINEDLDRLIRICLFKSFSKVSNITSLDNTILLCKCDDWYYIRVNSYNFKSSFKYRKLYYVKDIPETTRYNYIPFKHKF